MPPLALRLGWDGGLAASHEFASILAVVPALFGMMVGQAFRRRIEPIVFRWLFLVFLLLLGLEMASRPFF